MSPDLSPIEMLLAKADALLLSESDQFEVIDYRGFLNDEEAHSDRIQNLRAIEFRERFDMYRAALVSRYGPPDQTGSDVLCHIPICGILHQGIWTAGTKSLYLALSHEDRELPFVILLGITFRAS